MSQRRAFSVAIFARHEDRVLLIKHRRLETWLPVGGEIEPGETPLEAARRELREETGLEGRFVRVASVDGTPPGYIGYEEHLAGAKGLHMNFVFVAEVDRTEVHAHREFTEHRWLSDPASIDAPINVRQLAHLALHADATATSDASSLEQLARIWLSAFNARDLECLLSLYREDAVHTSPKLRALIPESGGEIRGKVALRSWWSDSMKRLPLLRYEERHLTASRDRVFMEYERINPGEASYLVAEVLVGERGLIRASHVFHG